MTTHPQSSLRIRRAGFTLAEILLAMLVFAIAITTILALLARSVETAQEILTKDEAISLSSSVENYMTSIPFIEAYEIVRDSNKRVLIAYQYRAHPTSGQPVQNPADPHQVVPWATEQANVPTFATLSPALESRLFRVLLSVSPANPAGPTLHPSPNTGDPLNYNSAVVVIFAEFYPVPTVDFTPGNTVQPVFSFNFAVRR